MAKKTAEQILDVAQEIVRNRGYSGFSYADISDRVGIRKASIHYHFPAKDELVRELVRQYRQLMSQRCDRIAKSELNPQEQLMAFANLYREGLEQEQICLCAMLAADFAVLPLSVREELHLFFQETQAWLTQLLEQGCQTRGWHCYPSAGDEARGLIALLQGTQLLARLAEDRSTAFIDMVHPVLLARFA